MARAITWAIRLTFEDGRMAFLRAGGRISRGPIATFYTKYQADIVAASVRQTMAPEATVDVIERSHGRQAG